MFDWFKPRRLECVISSFSRIHNIDVFPFLADPVEVNRKRGSTVRESSVYSKKRLLSHSLSRINSIDQWEGDHHSLTLFVLYVSAD